uniref:Tripartite motif-containing protein 3-like isoform X1 n=1 Tax=Crassostrea virginica TaxID=6565 RepID=A0A8B8BMD8_CRAVI|nr:tripartite motif-containing protein 3-like isoform X1 [Crassostrea virginica]XP_022304498.1 tripartite motif-containing protein 3-like isoform X1 [Crassostrea virginica]
MDPQYSAQDIVRCDLCETPVPPMCCDICHINLCKSCVGEHLSDRSKEHKVVPFEERGSTINYPKCRKHPPKTCEVHCKHCNIPICASCVSSGDHDQHKKIDILKILTKKKELIEKDLQELKKLIRSKFQQAASKIPAQKAGVKQHSLKLTAALNKQGEALHKEINSLIQRKQYEIEAMDEQHLAAITTQEEVINKALHEIKQIILDLQKLLDSDDVCLVSEYTSRNEEFRSLPAQFQVTLPTFSPQEINREQLYQQLGSLSQLLITYPLTDEVARTTEEHGGLKKTPGAVSSPPARPFSDKLLSDSPRILNDIQTEFGGINNGLYSVSCLSDEEIWTRDNNKIMKLYNLKGKLLKSIQTKSGNVPADIAVTQSGGLVYTDWVDRSINLVSGTQIQTLITLRGWTPYGLCSTSTGDLLVIMTSDDDEQKKVVRYSGSTKKQTIQWDDQGKPLYSSNRYNNTKYLSENRNLDICVADCEADAVVVVSAAGKLRFRYTGPPSTPKESFDPVGITTDSQANILTSDFDNQRIHIIDQDGRFLRFIHNCGLQRPWGLCVDSQDNLFVAERNTGKVKKIRYYK